LYFNFHIIVDGTFCQAALQNKINIKEQLPKYLDAEIQLCILSLAVLTSDRELVRVSAPFDVSK
jgi:U3 small nucleolar RNA-associated protein 23